MTPLEKMLNQNPQEIAAEMKEFSATHKFLDTQHQVYTKRYSKRWVAAYKSEVIADAETWVELMGKVNAILPSARSVSVQFFERNPKKLIV